MYYFDLKGLVERLTRSPLTTHEQLNYLFAWFVLWTVTSWYELFMGSSKGAETWAGGLVGVAFSIVVLAIVWAVLVRFYNANGGDQGEDFLSNLLAVGFVVSFRITVVSLPLIIIAYVLAKASADAAVATVVGVVLLVGSLGILFYMVQAITGALKQIRVGRISPPVTGA